MLPLAAIIATAAYAALPPAERERALAVLHYLATAGERAPYGRAAEHLAGLAAAMGCGEEAARKRLARYRRTGNWQDLLSLATDTSFEDIEGSYNGISIPDTLGITTRQLAENMLLPSFGNAYDPLRYAIDPQDFNPQWHTDSPWYYTGENAPYLGGKTLENGAIYGAYPTPYALLFSEGADTVNLRAPIGTRPWTRTATTHITTPNHNLFIALYGADDGNGTLMTASWYGTYNYAENNGITPGGEEETTPPSATHRPTGGGGGEENPDNPDPTDPDNPNNHLILLELSDEMELAGELEDTEYTILAAKDIIITTDTPAVGEIHWKNTFTAPGQYATVDSGFGIITAQGKQPAATTARLLFHGTNNIDTSKKEATIPITWHITATATIPAGALLAKIPKNTAPAPADGTITVTQTDTYTYHLALNHTAIAAKIARKLTGIIGSTAKKHTIENTTATAETPSATITLTATGNLKKQPSSSTTPNRPQKNREKQPCKSPSPPHHTSN